MARQAIVPRSETDPGGFDRRERAAIKDFNRRIARIGKLYQGVLDRLDFQAVTVNAVYYEFRTLPDVLAQMLDQTAVLVDAILLEGGPNQLWFSQEYVVPSYEQGTAQSWANLGAQTQTYQVAKPSLQSVLLSEPYQRRLGLLRAREFELMQGLSNTVKSQMAQTLTQGLAQGIGPREIGRRLSAQTGIEQRRAQRIARTEVGQALRQARMDEAQATSAQFDLPMKMMHLSALSPTTRATHAARHGHLYDVQDERNWLGSDANSINCFLPGTRVRGRFVAGSKARYDGVAVRLVAADGSELTVTANHPVLTPAGLIVATELRKGDYLYRYRDQIEHPVGVTDLHGQLVEARIEQVVGSLMQIGHSVFAGVHAVDFHGDGAACEEQVEIVTTEGMLVTNLDAKAAKTLDKLQLEHPDAVRSSPQSSALFDFQGFDLPPSRRLGVCSKSLALFAGQSAHTQLGGVASTPDCGAAVAQASNKRRPADSESSRQSQDGLAGQESGAYLVEIVDVQAFHYAGPVFDLEEVSGLMIAEGLITSNCKCSMTEVLVDEKGEPLAPGIVERTRRRGEEWNDGQSD